MYSKNFPPSPKNLLTILFAVLTFAILDGQTIRIVPIGDSITQGRGGDNPTYSWRYPLWQMLIDAEVDFDFVGSIDTGFVNSPDWTDYEGIPFDRDHEGHWGWTTRAIREELMGWLQGYTPDIALILLGTNDGRIYNEDERITGTIAEHTELVRLLRTDNPNIAIILGGAFQEWNPFPELRMALAALADELSTATSPVLYVDHSPGWISNPDNAGTHTVDWVHPNQAGDLLLAENWFPPLAGLLPLRYGLWRYLNIADRPDNLGAGIHEDPDEDEIPNLAEYAWNLDPNQTDKDMPGRLEIFTNEAGDPWFRFSRNLEATDVRYRITASSDGADWEAVIFDSTVDAFMPPDSSLVEMAVPHSNSPIRFYRLEMSLLESSEDT